MNLMNHAKAKDLGYDKIIIWVVYNKPMYSHYHSH